MPDATIGFISRTRPRQVVLALSAGRIHGLTLCAHLVILFLGKREFMLERACMRFHAQILRMTAGGANAAEAAQPAQWNRLNDVAVRALESVESLVKGRDRHRHSSIA